MAVPRSQNSAVQTSPQGGRTQASARIPNKPFGNVLRAQNAGVNKNKITLRARKLDKIGHAVPLTSIVGRYTSKQLASKEYLHGKRVLGWFKHMSLDDETNNAKQLPQTLKSDEECLSFAENELKKHNHDDDNDDDDDDDKHAIGYGGQRLAAPSKPNSEAEFLDAARQLAAMTSEHIPIHIHLQINLRLSASGGRLAAPILVTLREPLDVVQLWHTIKAEHGWLLGKLTGLRPNGFFFRCSPRIDVNGRTQSLSHQFEKGITSPDVHKVDVVFQEFLQFCVKRGSIEAKAILRNAQMKAKRAKALWKSAARFAATGFEREVPRAQIPVEAPVYAEMKITF